MSLTSFFTSSNSDESGFQQLMGDAASAYSVYDAISGGASPAEVSRAAGSAIPGTSAGQTSKPTAKIFGVAWYWAVIAVIMLALLGFGIYKLAA